MIGKRQYVAIRKKYGKVSSWAVWAPEEEAPKSNIGNLSVFEDSNIINILNPDYVFIGLNVSGSEWDTSSISDWRNFHSNSPRANDYKLRYALKGTSFWGSYITDVIKKYPDTNGGNVMKYLKEHPHVIKENISILEDELTLLDSNPMLIAMGDKSFNILAEELSSKYEIRKIKHASYTMSKENYRDELLSILS